MNEMSPYFEKMIIFYRIKIRVLKFALQEVLLEPNKYSAYFCNSGFFVFYDQIENFLLCYLFFPEYLNDNNNLNENDKKLIIRCCNLMNYLYMIDVGEEIDLILRENIIIDNNVYELLRIFAGYKEDELRESQEKVLKDKKITLTRVNLNHDFTFL